jgi:hypothetical protein
MNPVRSYRHRRISPDVIDWNDQLEHFCDMWTTTTMTARMMMMISKFRPVITTTGSVVKVTTKATLHRMMTSTALLLPPQRPLYSYGYSNAMYHRRNTMRHMSRGGGSGWRWNSTGPVTNHGRLPIPPAPRIYPKVVVVSASSAPPPMTAKAAAAASLYARTANRGPVSWTSLFLITVVAASAVTYYQIERERRLETALGKIVSSEYNGTAAAIRVVGNVGIAAAAVTDRSSSSSTPPVVVNGTNNNINNDDDDDGWTPRPGYLAKRKFIATPSGWFPIDDGYGPCECVSICIYRYIYIYKCCGLRAVPMLWVVIHAS